jgi:hypothetical protein
VTEGYSPPTAPDLYVERPVMQPPPNAVDEPGTADVAKEQAAGVGQAASDAGQHVAGVAKDQSLQVANEAGRQAKDLLGQAQSQAKDQAMIQQEKAVGGLRALSSELASMSRHAEDPGVASDLARQASQRAETLAGWLDGREPAAILDDVTAFARRRPGTFLAIAGGIGFLAGRLTRGLKQQPDSEAQPPSSSQPPTVAGGVDSYLPVAPAIPPVPPYAGEMS